MKSPIAAVVATLWLSGLTGCATTAVDPERFTAQVPDAFNCEYIEEDGTQAWKCGSRGLFAADYALDSHDAVVTHWKDYVMETAPDGITPTVEGGLPPLEHAGRKYPVSMIRFRMDGRTAMRTIVLSTDSGNGQRGWACMTTALTADDEAATWCGKMLKGLVIAQR